MPKRSEEELQELKVKLTEFLEARLSQGQIADKLGMTRNQVHGLINRLLRGYKPVHHERVRAAGKPEAPLAAEVKSGPRPRPSNPVTLEPLPIVSLEVSFEPPEGKLNIWNVKRNHCRYLDEEGYFCGEPAVRASYCQHHYNRCYTPTQRKVRPWPNSQRSPFENFA